MVFSCFGSGKPVNFSCGKDHYILYESSSYNHVTIKNGELLDSTKVETKTYGDDDNAIIISFDQWGENGGFHLHHLLIFSEKNKKITLNKRMLDADNTPRGDEDTENCAIDK